MTNKKKIRTPESKSRRMALRIMKGEDVIYDPEIHIPLLLEIFSQGLHVSNFCAEAEICTTNFQIWLNHYPDFAKAYSIAKALGLAWYEETGKKGLTDSFFNSGLWSKIMNVKFGYTDKRKISVEGLKEAKSFYDQYVRIKDEVDQGNLTVDEAVGLTNMISQGATIAEKTDMAKDIEMLKETLLKDKQ